MAFTRYYQPMTDPSSKKDDKPRKNTSDKRILSFCVTSQRLNQKIQAMTQNPDIQQNEST
jgi:hypothetical protein